MLILDQLNLKEKIYLTELVRAAQFPLEISADTLSSLKRGALEYFLTNVKIDPRKRKVLAKIIAKITGPPFILEGELTIPKERRIE